MQWSNKLKVFEIDSNIVEWDMHSANLSICKEYGLLTPRQIDKISKLPKLDRNIAIGKIGQKSKEFAKSLEEHFDIVVNEFIEQNNLNRDDDILDIRKDAVFTINKKITHSKIGNNIEFIPKHQYHSFIRLDRFDFLMNDTEMSVKGFQEYQELHQDGMLDLIRDALEMCSEYHMDSACVNEYLSDMVNLYKNYELDIEYYREFNNGSSFTVIDDGNVYSLKTVSMDYIKENNLTLDISYNYLNLILPLIRILR